MANLSHIRLDGVTGGSRGVSVLLRMFWLCALMWCGTAGHGAAPLQWDASLGFDGAYKDGAWAPVFVDISNQGDSQAGRIEVPINTVDPMSRGNPRLAITYAVPVEAPRNSRKRYLLYVPPERVEKIYLKLDRTEQEIELSGARVADRTDSLIVVLGGDTGLLKFLQGAQAAPRSGPAAMRIGLGGGPMRASQSGGPFIQVGRAEWDSLPDSWLGWDGVDAVVLGNAGFAGASPESVEALLRWVESGGTLIVPGGALAQQMASSQIGPMLPLVVRGTTSAPGLGALAAWVQQQLEPGPVLLAAGTLVKGASVLCGSPDEPLIAVRTVGAGRVAMAAFDYTSAPVKYWDGQTAMWQRLIAQAPASPSLTEGGEQKFPYGPYGQEIALSDAAAYTPAAALPSFWLLLGFLGAYIIVLVPVNYAVLKRWDKRELAWVTTPVIVIAFTLGAYVFSYGMRGGEIILNRLAVIEAAPGMTTARGRGYVGLFSPGRDSYELLLKGTAAGARIFANQGERGSRPPTVLYGPEPKIGDIRMNMWTSRAFCVEFLADLKGGLDGFFEFDGKNLNVSVTNNTGHKLERCRLIHANTQGTPKHIAAGGSIHWQAGRLTGIGDRNSSDVAGQLPQAPIKQGMEELAVRSLFGGRSYGYGGPGGTVTSNEPYLVAVIEDPLVPVELARSKPQVNDLNIFVARLPLRLAPGRRINVPKWMITGRPIAADGSIGGGQPWEPLLTISQGSVVFEFRVPFGDRGGTARALTLTAVFAPAPSPGAVVVLSAFNHRTNNWDRLAATMPLINIPHAADYMSRDGRILVKIATPGDAISFSEVAIAGTVDTL